MKDVLGSVSRDTQVPNIELWEELGPAAQLSEAGTEEDDLAALDWKMVTLSRHCNWTRISL